MQTCRFVIVRRWELVHARHPDVIVVGRSLGSSLAIQLAAEKPVSRLVLITPFESILSIAKRTAPFLPMSLLLRDKYESWRYAPRVPCPTLVIAASHDELVPLATMPAQTFLPSPTPNTVRTHTGQAAALATAVTNHATPVGSGTVARTQRIPIERRAEAAVIAWMRHQTTAYDSMKIARVKGQRREVRRMLAQRSKELLGAYRRGESMALACPLARALAACEGAAGSLQPTGIR